MQRVKISANGSHAGVGMSMAITHTTATNNATKPPMLMPLPHDARLDSSIAMRNAINPATSPTSEKVGPGPG